MKCDTYVGFSWSRSRPWYGLLRRFTFGTPGMLRKKTNVITDQLRFGKLGYPTKPASRLAGRCGERDTGKNIPLTKDRIPRKL